MRLGMLLGQTGVLAVAAVVDQASGHPDFSSYLRESGSLIPCFRLKKYTEKIQGEGLQGYAKAGVNAGRRLSARFPDSYSFLFTPPPMGGCGNPQLIRDILDCCNWLMYMPGYPLKGSMEAIRVGNEQTGEEGGVALTTHHDAVSFFRIHWTCMKAAM
jgi:hypothetical protein